MTDLPERFVRVVSEVYGSDRWQLTLSEGTLITWLGLFETGIAQGKLEQADIDITVLNRYPAYRADERALINGCIAALRREAGESND